MEKCKYILKSGLDLIIVRTERKAELMVKVFPLKTKNIIYEPDHLAQLRTVCYKVITLSVYNFIELI